MNCYWNDWYHNHREKILIKKSQWRKGELNSESTKGRSYIYEQIICITLDVKNLNIENDNWNFPTDGDKHEKYGYLSIKGAVLEYCGDWGFADTNKGKFNTLMLICMSKDNEHVDRVYAVPEEEAKKRTGIKISIGSKSWIDKYIIDEKPFDDNYHKIIQNMVCLTKIR